MFVSAVTELPLAPDPQLQLVSDRNAKGSYYDAYDDHGPGLAVAFQLSLTPASWPADWGGHMELLDGPTGRVTARQSPQWNTLDLFDIRQPGAWRRSPTLMRHMHGYIISGWYHTPDPAHQG